MESRGISEKIEKLNIMRCWRIDLMEIYNKDNFRNRILLLYLIPILFIVITIRVSFGNVIWSDEVYSLELSAKKFADILRIDSMDVHPPLYYFLLRIAFIAGGIFNINNIVSGKLLSVIAEILLFYIGATKINAIFGRNSSILYCLFLVAMPQMMEYFTEIRMYGLGALFVTCTYLYGMDVLNDDNDRKAYILLTIFSIFSVYTHYYACIGSFIVYIEMLVFLFSKRKYNAIKKVFVSGIIVAVSFVPWILVLTGQLKTVKADYWIPPVSLSSIKTDLNFIIAENDFKISKLAILLLISFGAAGITLLKKNKKDYYAYGAAAAISVLLGTYFVGIAVSIAMRPVFVSRYLFCSLPCFWLGIAIGLSEFYSFMKTNKLVRCILVLILLISVINTSYGFLTRESERQKNDDIAVSKIKDIAGADTVIVCNLYSLCRTLVYYCPERQTYYTGEIPYIATELHDNGNFNEITVDDIKNYSNIIVCDNNNELYETLSNMGLTLEKQGDFAHYWDSYTMYYIK
ncbi:hypothetical protein QYZ88_003390 [Lachnospiraceae bacterium C1.1]|nr:glycosyltransferase family 39 protein [Lachnospiraceae bacterium C1.1]